MGYYWNSNLKTICKNWTDLQVPQYVSNLVAFGDDDKMWKYRTATINGLCIDCYTHVQPEFWWQIFRFRNSVNCYWNLCVTVLFFEWLCGSVLWAAAFLWTLFKLIVKNVFSSTSAFRKPVYWWLFWSTFSYRNDCVLCSRCIFPSKNTQSTFLHQHHP